MKLIIAGSRTITSYALVRQAIIDSGLWRDYKHELEIVCGMARGVDLLGKQFAERNGLVCHEFPADWDKHGKAAGHIRNKEMGDFADALVAIWNGRSRGAQGMIQYMKKLGRFVYVEFEES